MAGPARTSIRSSAAKLAVLALAPLALATAQASAADRTVPSGTRFGDTFHGVRLDPARWVRRWGELTTTGGAVELASRPPRVPAETHSSLVTSRSSWRDFDLRLRMGARRQLRTGSPPNVWETAWVMFRFRGLHDYYYFILKPTGWELGKKQGSDAQIFLATGGEPRLAIGADADVRITAVGKRIDVFVGGAKVVSFADRQPLTSGSIGLYEEDSVARFSSLRVAPLP